MRSNFIHFLFAFLMIATLPVKAQQYNVNDAVLIDMYQNQHYKEAADYLKQNCPEPITNMKILSRLAYTYQMAGRSNEAESYYQRMYNIDSTSIPVILNLALINSNRENKPKAIRYYEKAASIDNNNFEVYKQLGRLYTEKSDTLNALKNLLKANSIDYENADVASDLSAMLLGTNKIKQAEVVLVRALAADSTNLILLRQVVKLLYTTNRFKETITACKKILGLGDNSTPILIKLGTSYYKIKSYECCIETFATLPGIFQTEGTCYLTAMSYKALKRYQPALDNLDLALKQAISAYTDSYYNEIADIDDKLKQFRSEAAAYQKSLFFNNNSIIYYSLADMYDKNLHDKRNALKYYKKYLDTKPPAKDQQYITYVKSRITELNK